MKNMFRRIGNISFIIVLIATIFLGNNIITKAATDGNKSLDVINATNGYGYVYVNISDKKGNTCKYRVVVKLTNLASRKVSGGTVYSTDTNGTTKVDSVSISAVSGINSYGLKYVSENVKLTETANGNYGIVNLSFSYKRPKCSKATYSVNGAVSGTKASFTTPPKAAQNHSSDVTEIIKIAFHIKNGNMYKNEATAHHATFNVALNQTVDKYKLSYDLAGGQGSFGEKYYEDNVSFLLPNNVPTRKGYTFLYWKNGTYTYSKGAILTLHKNEILTAVWSQNTYNINFYVDDDYKESMSVKYGNEISSLPSLSAYGYDFDGWFTSDNKKIENGQIYNIASDIDVYAKMVSQDYKIIYDPNGADSGNMETQRLSYDETANLFLNNYYKKGYVFEGWSTDPNALIADYTDGQEISKLSCNDTITLYALWRPMNFYVYYYHGFGVVEGAENNPTIVKYSYEDADLTELPKENDAMPYYTSSKWCEGMDGTGASFLNLASIKEKVVQDNQIIQAYPYYEPNQFEVEFVDAESGQSVMESFYVKYGEYIVLPNLNSEGGISKKGHNFKGWRIETEDQEGTIFSDNFTASKENIDLSRQGKADDDMKIRFVAVWKPIEVTFRFNSDYTTDSELNSIVVKYGEKIPELPLPKYNKYDFLYWATEDGKRVNANDINNFDSLDVTLEARTKMKEITVNYYVNRNLYASKRVYINTKAADINVRAPKKRGYKFAGWIDGDKKAITNVKIFTKDYKVYATFKKVNQPAKVKRFKAKYSNKKLKISFRKSKNIKGYVIKFKYKKKTYTIKISNKGKKRTIKRSYRKIPKTRIKLNGRKKVKVSIYAYRLDSYNKPVKGKMASKTVKPSKKRKKVRRTVKTSKKQKKKK